MVSEGLIDRLPHAWSDDVGECVSPDDLRALLRSDETREALAEAISRVWWVTGSGDSRTMPDEMADAVVRVLAGDPTEEATK